MDSSLEFSNSFSSVSSLPARCRIYKIIVIGDSNVGKTCLTHRLCAGEFPKRTEPTIGVDFRDRVIDFEGEKIKFQLWDTAGQERFRKSMVPHYYRNVHAVLFVYDVTSPASFRGLPAWMEECRQNSLGQEIPRFLVGNKSDLRDQAGPGAQRQVSREQAAKFAEAHGMTLFETSALGPGHRSMGGGGGGRGRGGGVGTRNQQERVEDVLLALGARLSRQRKVPEQSASVGGHTGSFKLPVKKKKSEKDVWPCTC